MTQQEAADAIGQKFKIDDPDFARWTDTIVNVTPTGIVEGHILIAHCSNCRFVNPQPEQLKKKKELQ